MTSVAAPGPVGTISLMGRLGQVWAKTCPADMTVAQHSAMRSNVCNTGSTLTFWLFGQCILAHDPGKRWSAMVSGELLLVGSIPLDTPQEVFESFGALLGKYLFAMPDGEVGPRRHWISRVHYQVLAAHPELEVVQHPAADENGIERQHPRDAADAWWFRVKDDVRKVRFGDPGWRLGFARDAINSYF